MPNLLPALTLLFIVVAIFVIISFIEKILLDKDTDDLTVFRILKFVFGEDIFANSAYYEDRDEDQDIWSRR